MNTVLRQWAGAGLVALAVLGLGGCATAPSSPAGAAAAPLEPSNPDPWEAWNRKVYGFNDAVDRAVLKPVAETYQKVVPGLVRTGISNVLGNIGDLWSAANHLLQGKIFSGLDMGMRVLTNTLFGLGGLLDPATEMGLERRSEDFGQTLGRWGVPSGPYLVLPLLGPSTVRDGTGLLLLDRQASASRLPPTENGRLGVTAVQLLDVRAGLLSTTQLLDQVALDKYSFIRDGFLARRRDAIADGAAPADAGSEDPGDGPPPTKPAAATPAAAKAEPKPAPKP